MDTLENDDNIKVEEVCRTCLTDDGHFFNITDIFDHHTLLQMIQNITNLQMNPLDGYTQSICFQCVKEVRRANQFRIKCLESNDTLMKVDIKTVEVPVTDCEVEIPKVEKIKQELVESSQTVDDILETADGCKLETKGVESDCEYNGNPCIEIKEEDDKDYKNKNFDSRTIIFDCPLCHGLFFSNKIYQKHISDLHPDKLKDECFTQKREPLGFILKKKSLKNIKCTYKCALDDFIGNTFVEFNSHMKEHTGEKPVVCIECEFRTTKISLLKLHRLQKHVEEKRFSCPLCNYCCQTKRALTIHSAIHTGEKNYKCKLCSMTFRHPSILSAHKKEKHENRKPHVCSICQKAFFRSTELTNHMRSHTGERPFVCHFCGKGFMRVDNLKAHVAMRHEPIKTLFKCELCDYTTKIKFKLKIHTMRHNGEKPLKCPECPFSCSETYNLKLHILRHTGEKSFTCDMCDYKGYTADSIKRHKLVHTGEKSFACAICDYRGNTNNSLKRHMQTHNPEQKYQCPHCPYKTNVRDTLAKHIRKSCVIKKRGRRPSKVPIIPDILMNEDITEDSEECLTINELPNYV